ncbi:ATP-binding protein [Desulfovibrio litoralis]|uniref:AAA+ ATPase domain-containing protein n=1 Tax=Desulfovibrio litoralis DSM 11393 TaxID=1121455 RepID=A0A1M7S8H2_9BACT|nr:ATP-binding protein [Desulfovibrio litoralis]SHN54718.1 hypothetical protein SAMN02745728_00575 [Desulfovibrio litoralis DSM 11393]
MLIFNINTNDSVFSPKEIIKFAESSAVTTNVTKEYAIMLLLKDKNVLSQICEQSENVGESLKKAALADLRKLMEYLKELTIKNYIPSIKRTLFFSDYQKSIEDLVEESSTEKILEKLICHYKKFGGGELAQYIAFYWRGGLCGVSSPDDIKLDELFCVEAQKQILKQNIKSFLQGNPTNNVILYGNSGGGKSSIVKALLNEYYTEGLRLVQIFKDDLSELTQLMSEIKNKSFKYIIFLDDLSFESNELGYKNLKVLLDGNIEKQPQNVLIYATSNRRHLIGETWNERQGEDVHVSDTRNEKMSLAERFGLRVYFGSLSQPEYLEIVKSILLKHEVSMTEEIQASAIEWELDYNGRSGRTAMQFVKNLLNNKS